MEPTEENLVRQIEAANLKLIDEVTQGIIDDPSQGEEVREHARFATVPEFTGLHIERHRDLLCLPSK